MIPTNTGAGADESGIDPEAIQAMIADMFGGGRA